MKLSIITINYNNREGLRKTIDSVISQTWQDFEWIIVDGGSTDGSRELIEQTTHQLASKGWNTEQFSGPEDPASFIADHLPSINDPSSIDNSSSSHRLLWCSEKDKGIYNAMNKGIVHAQGDYFHFLNSGDCYYSNITLQKIYKFNLSADIVYGDWKIEGNFISKQYINQVNISSLYKNNICHQAMFIRSSILKEEGFDESFRILADWARWMKLICMGGVTFKYVPIIVCMMESGGISTNQNIEHDNELKRIREIPPHPLREILQENFNLTNQLSRYEGMYVLRDALGLIEGHPNIFRAYRLFNAFISSCQKIFNLL